MKRFLLFLWCLIFMLPKAEWDSWSPEKQTSFKIFLGNIYFEKHPGKERASLKAYETENGYIRFEVCEPEVQS